MEAAADFDDGPVEGMGQIERDDVPLGSQATARTFDVSVMVVCGSLAASTVEFELWQAGDDGFYPSSLPPARLFGFYGANDHFLLDFDMHFVCCAGR